MIAASVIVCTRDQAPRLRLVLRALAVQSTPPREIIVVDDASTDATEAVVGAARRIIRSCDVAYVRNPAPLGSAGARNEGARRATGDLLVFLDGDALATRDHVARHVALQTARGPVLGIGPLWHTTTTEFLRDPSTGERFDAIIPAEVQHRLDHHLAEMLIRPEDVVERFATIVERSAPGAYPGLGFVEAEGERLGDAAEHPAAWVLMTPHNACVPRAAFERVGGFATDLPFSEGWDLALRLRAAGVPILREPSAPTYHLYHYRRFADFDEQLRRWRAAVTIADAHRRRGLVFALLYFLLMPEFSGFPHEARIANLDELAARIASATDDLGAYEVLLRGHPSCSELEDARARPTPAVAAGPPRAARTPAPTWRFERVAGPVSAIAEGPIWDGTGVRFSDIPNRVIRRYDPRTRRCEVWGERTFAGNGLALDAHGRLVVCEGGTARGGRRIVRYEADGTRTVLADRYRGRRLNAPNDVVVDRSGRIWFSDPCYGNRLAMELLHESIYRLDPGPGGTPVITRMTYDTRRPNGLVLSADERTLFVAESPLPPEPGRQLRAYPIDADSALGDYRVVHDFGADRGVDGMRLDADGNVVATVGWAQGGAGPRIAVVAPDGDILAEHPVPAEPTNCCFGEDGTVLYVTTIGGELYRAQTDRIGAGFATSSARTARVG